MTPTMSTDRAHDLLPAAPTFTAAPPADEPTAARPFGLSFVTDAPAEGPFDPGELVFDEERQIVVALGPDGTISPSWGTHTSTSTKTNTGTSDSTQESADSDTADS